MSKNNVAKLGAAGLALVALLCAAMAAIFVGRMLSARGYTGKRIKAVVVAKRNIPAAQQLAPGDLVVADWPEASVPEGAFSDIDALFASDKPPVATTGILKGEPVVSARLASAAEGTGIASLIEPNMRAVALLVDDAIGKTNLVYPGVFVDVIVTIRVPDEDNAGIQRVVSKTAVERARVLTVGTRTDVATRVRPKKKKNTDTTSPRTYVTLEVTPAEAEIIAMARNVGNLNLALRNSNDKTLRKDATTTTAAAAVAAADVAEDGEQPTANTALGLNAQGEIETSVTTAVDSNSRRSKSHSKSRTRGSIRVHKPRSSSRHRGSTHTSGAIETYRAPN